MRIYLDNNASTPIHPAVLERMDRVLRDVWGNASSIHREGQAARRVLEEAREQVALLINAEPRDVVFTSGGTESNNAAIHGSVLSTGGRCHIVTSSIEHPSVLEPIRELARRGHPVSYVRCDSNGLISADEVIDSIRPDTGLVSLMLANNETGVIQPVQMVGRYCRQNGIHFHCDAVQAAGRLSLDVEQLSVDTLTLSAHKLHAPKGVGLLYVRRGAALTSILSGGMQERRRRAGTENVPLASAFGAAAGRAVEGLKEVSAIGRLRDGLEEEIRRRLPFTTINGEAVPRIANTSNILFRGIDAESLVIALDLEGVAVSTGSACSSGRVEPSHVLLQMGLDDADARSSVRFSLSRFNTVEEIDHVSLLACEIVGRNLNREMVRSS